MNFDVGLHDRLFGERITIEVPTKGGGTRSVSVTKRWLERMQSEGKMSSLATVTMHVADPVRGCTRPNGPSVSIFRKTCMSGDSTRRKDVCTR